MTNSPIEDNRDNELDEVYKKMDEQNASLPENDCSFYTGRQHHHHHSADVKPECKKMKRWKKVLLIVLCAILGLTVVALSVWGVLNFVGKNNMKPNHGISVSMLPDDVSTDDGGETIQYNGETYMLNEDITSILLMGVDKTELDANGIVGSAGQADAIYVLAFNVNTGEMTAIVVSRDSLVDVDVYDKNGKFTGVENEQLCMSFAYGNGKDTSCANTAKSVSRLLLGMQIDNYISFDVEAISKVNDAIGGVTVPEYDNDGNPTGNMTTVYGKKAIKYVKSRNQSVLDSNNARINRQLEYIKAFTSKALSSDISTLLKVYNAAGNDTYSNIPVSNLTALGTTVFTNGIAGLNYERIEGFVQASTKDGKAEYVVDSNALFQTILKVYYIKM